MEQEISQIKEMINVDGEMIEVSISEEELNKYIRNRLQIFTQRAVEHALIEKFGHKPKKGQRKAYKRTEEYQESLAKMKVKYRCTDAEKALAGDSKTRKYFRNEIAQKKARHLKNRLDYKRAMEEREKKLADFIKTMGIDEKLISIAKEYEKHLCGLVKAVANDKRREQDILAEHVFPEEYTERLLTEILPDFNIVTMFDEDIYTKLLEQYPEIERQQEFTDDLQDDLFEYIINSDISRKIFENIDTYVSGPIMSKKMQRTPHGKADIVQFPGTQAE